MKKVILAFILLSSSTISLAQENIDDLLAAGVNDAKTFTTEYIAPASEALVYSINNGWFSNGKSPKKYGFEISIIGNASFIKDGKKTFLMNTSDYANVRFADGSTSKMVATALGHNDPDIVVEITYDDIIFQEQTAEFTLPTGLGSANINLIPTAFLQVGFSPFEGTQLKGRFFPKTQTEDAHISLYGIGLQQELTAWLPEDSTFPVAISAFAAYTHLDGSYDFTEEGIVEGENQQINTDVNTLLLELIVGTKLNIINFYGGLGFVSGTTTTDLLGTYRVTDGFLFSEEIVDPFSIEQKDSGLRATLGTNLTLGFFGINADYTFAEFNSASLGLNFSF